MRLPGSGLGIIGGPQGSKQLLDAVRQSVETGDLETITELAREFTAVDANITKCVDSNGNSIAHLALGKRAATLEFVIVTLKADVNAANFHGRTPLHEAATKNYVECCETLLNYGADDTVHSATLSTPFHTAAACGSVECMEVLLKHTEDPVAKVNELDRNGSAALHKCAYDGDVRVSRWLVDHGATVDVRDTTGTTPLLAAVKMGQRAVVSFLLSKGADVNTPDGLGNTGVHLCAVRCDVEMLRLLIGSGASVEVTNAELNTPLHVAALHPRPEMPEWEELIAVLLEAGCDPTKTNASQRTPADYMGRSLKRVFQPEEVARRRSARAAEVAASDETLSRAVAAMRQTWRQEAQQSLEQRKALERAEDERLAREVEDAMQADDDVRTRLEEVQETLRYQLEEITKRQALIDKANGIKTK